MSSILKGIGKGAGKNLQGDTSDFHKSNGSNNSAAKLVKHVKVARDYLGKDPEPKKEPEETNESYWGGPSPAQLRFNAALELERNKPENKADREKFQKEIDRIMGPRPVQPKDEPDNSNPVTESSGTTAAGYTWRFEPGREVPWKTDADANTFIRVTDPAGKTVAGVWADVAGDSLEIEYSQVFDEELRGRGLYTDLLKSLSGHYDITSDTDANNAAASIYKRLGADYDHRQATHRLRKQTVAEGAEKITEYRDRMYQYLKSIVPGFPDYVVKDWLYANFARGHTTGQDAYLQASDSPKSKLYRYQYKTADNPNQDLKGILQAKQTAKNIMGPSDELAGKYNWTFATIGKDIPNILKDMGLSVDTKWQLVPNMKFTMDMWEPKTLKRLQARAGGSSKSIDPDVHIPHKDAERHATQAALAQQQGGVRKEPVILIKTSQGYELLEGWHRTIQHFAMYPQGYTGPAYVAVAQGQQGVAEGSNNNNITAQKIFFARSDKTPKGWSYDHVGFITQDGRQIQMSGHKGNDVYVTNNVTDDPEFPEQNIKIVSLSKPVSVPTTNSVGAENCGTFVANVLQANGIKGIDTQKIYSVFKQPPKQGVAEGRKKKNKKTSRSLGRYFFPGYGYYASGESGEGGGDGGGGESMAEGTNVDIGGIKLNVAVDGAEVIIRPIVDEYQAGYAVFDRDGNTLVPADLAIDEEFRGQGIAKIIYDYVKSLGFNILRSNDQTRAGKHFWDKNRGEGSQVWEHDMLDEACWKDYHKEGNKKMFGKTYPNYVKNTNEDRQQCPECGGPMFSEEMINEKKDACYYKVKSRYKVWPSAYASGALVQCRKKGANNWGTKSESSILEGIEQTDEDLHKWFKEKWVRFGPDGKIRGACARGDGSEGKPKCLPQSKAQNLGKKGRASAASRKRREDPNPERSGKAINVATKKKTTESSILQGISETKGLPMPSSYEQEYGPFKKKGGYRIMTLTSEQEELDEKWSNKYKRSIDCSHPKGFSQRAHCQGKKKK